MTRTTKLTTHDFHLLDNACELIRNAFSSPYLVGSAGMEVADNYRDVDVRLILGDQEFDALITHRERWELLSLAIGAYLRERTGLPVDFQIQRQTEANANHGGKARNPLGRGRIFAAGGDASPWSPPSVVEGNA